MITYISRPDFSGGFAYRMPSTLGNSGLSKDSMRLSILGTLDMMMRVVMRVVV